MKHYATRRLIIIFFYWIPWISLTKGWFQESLSPPTKIAGFSAKVRQKASAKSGDFSPLFLISSFDSIKYLPRESNLYLGADNSLTSSWSSGILHVFFSKNSRALYQSSALRFPHSFTRAEDSETLIPRVGMMPISEIRSWSHLLETLNQACAKF